MTNIKTKFRIAERVIFRYNGAGRILSGHINGIDILVTPDKTEIRYTVYCQEEIKGSNEHRIFEEYLKKEPFIPVH